MVSRTRRTLVSQRGEGKQGKSVERVGEVGGVGIRPTEGWPGRNAACRREGQSSWILEASPPCPLGTPAPSTLPAASATCFYFFPISLVQLIPPHQHKPVCQMPPLALVKRACEGGRRSHICLGPWAGGRLGERTAEPRTHQPIVNMPVWVWSSHACRPFPARGQLGQVPGTGSNPRTLPGEEGCPEEGPQGGS